MGKGADVPSYGSGAEIGSIHQTDTVHYATHCDQPPVNSMNDPLLLVKAVNLIDADVRIGVWDFGFFEVFGAIGIVFLGAIAVAIHVRHFGGGESTQHLDQVLRNGELIQAKSLRGRPAEHKKRNVEAEVQGVHTALIIYFPGHGPFPAMWVIPTTTIMAVLDHHCSA